MASWTFAPSNVPAAQTSVGGSSTWMPSTPWSSYAPTSLSRMGILIPNHTIANATIPCQEAFLLSNANGDESLNRTEYVQFIIEFLFLLDRVEERFTSFSMLSEWLKQNFVTLSSNNTQELATPDVNHNLFDHSGSKSLQEVCDWTQAALPRMGILISNLTIANATIPCQETFLLSNTNDDEWLNGTEYVQFINEFLFNFDYSVDEHFANFSMLSESLKHNFITWSDNQGLSTGDALNHSGSIPLQEVCDWAQAALPRMGILISNLTIANATIPCQEAFLLSNTNDDEWLNGTEYVQFINEVVFLLDGAEGRFTSFSMLPEWLKQNFVTLLSNNTQELATPDVNHNLFDHTDSIPLQEVCDWTQAALPRMGILISNLTIANATIPCQETFLLSNANGDEWLNGTEYVQFINEFLFNFDYYADEFFANFSMLSKSLKRNFITWSDNQGLSTGDALNHSGSIPLQEVCDFTLVVSTPPRLTLTIYSSILFVNYMGYTIIPAFELSAMTQAYQILVAEVVFLLATSTSMPSTFVPTGGMTRGPTASPTISPSTLPTGGPTVSPTTPPTGGPSTSPTGRPTSWPSASPSTTPPTWRPTGSPTSWPTASPTISPSTLPTGGPTVSPTTPPTGGPTGPPSTSLPSTLLITERRTTSSINTRQRRLSISYDSAQMTIYKQSQSDCPGGVYLGPTQPLPSCQTVFGKYQLILSDDEDASTVNDTFVATTQSWIYSGYMTEFLTQVNASTVYSVASLIISPVMGEDVPDGHLPGVVVVIISLVLVCVGWKFLCGGGLENNGRNEVEDVFAQQLVAMQNTNHDDGQNSPPRNYL
jgi:hypothetical protein